jgi:phage tail-like protein
MALFSARAAAGAAAAALLGGDPLVNYQYSVLATNGVGLEFQGYFSDVTGLALEISTVEYKTFNHNTGMPRTQYIPGRVNPGSVTLKRGMASNSDFWFWCQAVLEGDMALARATVGITLWQRKYIPLYLYTLYDAWPSKFSIGGLSASGAEFLVEEVTLVFESLDMFQIGI